MTETEEQHRVPLLEVAGVHKSFPGVRALEDMRLDLRSGEVLALVGENGAGKSTLMKLLSGIYTPDAGTFALAGEPLRATGPKHATALGISVIHQEFNLVPHLTVAQNIYLGREPRRGRLLLDERRLVRDATELLERLHLPLDPNAAVGRLTVANQQMVEIAKALSYDPKVLIMDEPTAALNDAEVATLHELIRRFVRPDTGAIYISHRMEEIRRIADRVTVIRDGNYVDTVDVASTTTPEIISMMVGRTLAENAGPQGVRADREVLLAVDGLSTRATRNTTQLKDVSFELRAGEILGFAGLMGAGRTETARAIVGADPITGGVLTLRGKPIRVTNPADAVSHGIGYLSEDRKRYGLLLDKDVKTNVTLGALRTRFTSGGFVNDRAVRTTAGSLVGSLRIKTPSVDQTTKFLSGGNQQKVVIAKWLARDCEVLIFDEPTRGIDVGAKEEIYQLLNELADQGKSIIMISSELPEILRMSHRVVVMSEGRVTSVLDAAEATQESIMHFATLRPDENPADAEELGLTPTEPGAVAAKEDPQA
ncbi:sugar ABC transporter ATP-binding protein [Actinophytocola sediminis]